MADAFVVNPYDTDELAGAIVLMHEGPSVPGALRLAALTLVLEALTERHYRCVIPAASQLR